MAYTGVVMLTGENVKTFIDYVTEKTGKNISIEEMKYKVVSDEVSESAKDDFIALCN